MNTAHEKAQEVLTTHRDKLDLISRQLIETETIDSKEFAALMSGQPLDPATPPPPPAPSAKPAATEPPSRLVGPAPAPLPA